MENEEQTSLTDTGEQDVDSTVGQEDADSIGSTDAILAKINEVSGREFKSFDDYTKHYKNLTSAVGDQTIAEAKKKAEALDKYASMLKPLAEAEGVSIDTYIELLNKNAKGEDLSKFSSAKEYEIKKLESEELSQLKTRLSEVEGELTKTKLERALPEAGKYFNDFTAWAKGTGKEVSAETFKSSPFMALVEADGNKGSSVIESNSRIAPSSNNEYKRALARAKDSGTTDDWADVLSMKSKLQE
jgi:hypothetical protein